MAEERKSGGRNPLQDANSGPAWNTQDMPHVDNTQKMPSDYQRFNYRPDPHRYDAYSGNNNRLGNANVPDPKSNPQKYAEEQRKKNAPNGGQPYYDTQNPFAQSYSQRKKEPFQFPWWAILLGFVTWWPLGFVAIFLNKYFEKNGFTLDKSFGNTVNTTTKTVTINGTTVRREVVNETAQTVRQARDAVADARPAASKRKSTRSAIEEAVRDADKKDSNKANLLEGIGIGVMVLFGLASVFTIGEIISMLGYGNVLYMVGEDLIPLLALTAAGGGMVFAGHKTRASMRMRRKILTIVGRKDNMAIADIAAGLGCTVEKCSAYLEACIEKGVFGKDAYLDWRSMFLVVRGAAPEPAEPVKAENPIESVETKQDEDAYSAILRQLRELNDRIPGEEMTDKIDRLEKVAAKIFRQAEKNPEKLPQMRKFMDYYLPTSLKLLQTYAELDAQGIEGENIRESKRRIETAMDTLVVAFEKQLDQLFEHDALDVSADIDVMQNMLAADGLTGDDPFKLHTI